MGNYTSSHRPLYQPLDNAAQQIRLLYKHSSTSELGYTLQLTTLKDVQDNFLALSYAWGSPEEVHSIPVNGIDVSVSSNLYEFLKVFHSQQERKLPIWIDQICINQNDMKEKESQIVLMGEIYSQARETLIWLGPDPDNGVAFHFIKTTNDDPRWSDKHSDDVWSNDTSSETRGAVVKMLQSQYWQRHWIVQEVCLARQRVLLYGSTQLSWETLRSWDKNFPSPASTSPYQPRPMSEDDALARLVRVQVAIDPGWGIPNVKNTKMIWQYAIKATAYSHCSDPRDKVYGIQSLFGKKYRIVPDYTKSTEQVYFEAMECAYSMIWGRRLSDFVDGAANLAIGMLIISAGPDIRGALIAGIWGEIMQFSRRGDDFYYNFNSLKWFDMESILRRQLHPGTESEENGT